MKHLAPFSAIQLRSEWVKQCHFTLGIRVVTFKENLTRPCDV